MLDNWKALRFRNGGKFMLGNGRDCQKFDCNVSEAATGRLDGENAPAPAHFTPLRNVPETAAVTPSFALKAVK